MPFQDGEDPQPGALEITDDDGKGLQVVDAGRLQRMLETNSVSGRTDETECGCSGNLPLEGELGSLATSTLARLSGPEHAILRHWAPNWRQGLNCGY